ncbi:MAG: hypothetical protein WA821_10780 [Anaerolineales bacterium]
MKKYFFVAMLVVSLFISGCGTSQTAPPDTPTPIVPTTAPQLSATVTALDRKAAILEEMRQAVFANDRLIEDEKMKGNLVQTPEKDQATGEKLYRYQGEAGSQLSAMSEETKVKISDLNDEYMALFGSQMQVTPLPLPDPMPVSQEEIERASNQSVTDYGRWMKDEEKSGTTVRVFDFSQMIYLDILIGDSFVRSQLKWQADLEYDLALRAPPGEEQALDIKAIQTIERGDVTLTGAGYLMPFYRADRLLDEYETTHWVYTVDTLSRQIVEIAPKNGLDMGTEIRPGGETLEQKARNFIKIAAPNLDLDALTPVPAQKETAYFFRWEDRSGALLDDGRSYPFIQVAIDAQGNLLNYYNTLLFVR